MTQASRARRPVRRVSRDRTRPPGPGGRYGLLLLVLIATYLLSAFSSGERVTATVQVGLVAVILVLALRTSPLPGRWPALIGVVTIAGSVAAVLGASLTGTSAATGVADLWKALMLLLTAVLIVRRVLARPAVTIQSIYGALSAYLVIGLMFAACYAAIQHLGGAPFFADGQPATTQTFQYFSFTTLTTLGYGDFTAAGNGSRAIAVMEATDRPGVPRHPGSAPRGRVPLTSRAEETSRGTRRPAAFPRVASGTAPGGSIARSRGEAPGGLCTGSLLTAAVSMDRSQSRSLPGVRRA